MRKSFLIALAAAVLLGTAPAVRADDESRAILDKAVKAHGGKDVIAKHKAEHVKTQGVLITEGVKVPFTAETFEQLPDRFKNVMKVNIPGQNLTLVQVLNGGQAWMTLNGEAQTITDKLLAEMNETVYVDQVTTLVPLLDGKGFTLTSLGKSLVRRRPAVGVKVESKGHREILLFFDEETGLLVKTERRALGPKQVNEVLQEVYYSEPKEIDGIKRPMKFAMYQDNEKVTEGEITDVRFPDKLDDKVFEKP